MTDQTNNFAIKFAVKAEKQARKLPLHIVKKLHKQLLILMKNMYHPSLRVKRMEGQDAWEARIDFKYRFTFSKTPDQILILTLGPHDEGLGKK